MFLQETYVIHDLWYYDTGTTDKGYWDTSNMGNASYSCSSNGITVSNSQDNANRWIALNIQYPQQYSVEYTIVGLTPVNNYTGEGIVEGVSTINTNTNSFLIYEIEHWDARFTVQNKLQANDVIKYEFDGTDVKVYRNGTLVGTKSKYASSNANGFYLRAYNGRGITVKNIKIKAL